MGNRWTIFCLPRCGSTLAAQLLTYWVHLYSPFVRMESPVNRGYGPGSHQPFDGAEYMVCRHYVDVDDGEREDSIGDYKADDGESTITEGGIIRQELKKRGIALSTLNPTSFDRFAIIENLTKRGLFPVIKNVVGHVPPCTYEAFRAMGYNVIVVERRDILAQFVSYEIAERSFFHIRTTSKRVRKLEPFVITRDSFDMFIDDLELLRSYEREHTVYYEDFVYDYAAFYKACGFTTEHIENYNFITTKRVDDIGKLNYVLNANEVGEWFNDYNRQ